jgi:hypothetical protein
MGISLALLLSIGSHIRTQRRRITGVAEAIRLVGEANLAYGGRHPLSAEALFNGIIHSTHQVQKSFYVFLFKVVYLNSARV